MNDVAIVIPAYKIDFFRDTLDSSAASDVYKRQHLIL